MRQFEPANATLRSSGVEVMVVKQRYTNSIIRPRGTVVSEGLVFYYRCLGYLFISLQYLRATSADRRETLPHDRFLGALYNPSPKIWRALPPKKKKRGQKHAKIWCHYTQLPTLIANVLGTSHIVQIRKHK